MIYNFNKKKKKTEAVDFLVFVVHGVGEAKRHYKKGNNE